MVETVRGTVGVLSPVRTTPLRARGLNEMDATLCVVLVLGLDTCLRRYDKSVRVVGRVGGVCSDNCVNGLNGIS